MLNIGGISVGLQEDIGLEQLSKANGYEYTTIKNKEMIPDIDVVVVSVSSGDHFLKACDWLLRIQQTSTALTWLILSNINKQEIEIYSQLGIVGWIQADEKHHLFQYIKNVLKNKDEYSDNSTLDMYSKLELDNRNSSITLKNGTQIRLTKLEYRVVEVLQTQENQTVTYSELGKILWDDDIEENVTYRVANIIFHLRNKLGEPERSNIQTIRSKGYRWIS